MENLTLQFSNLKDKFMIHVDIRLSYVKFSLTNAGIIAADLELCYRKKCLSAATCDSDLRFFYNGHSA